MGVGKVKSAPRRGLGTAAPLDLPARLPHKALNRWGIAMHEYKVVPAPSSAPRIRGLKTTGARFAHALTEAINAEAAGGWQFLRTETLPCEERGTLGKTRTSTQVVMIFGRPLGLARPDAGAALAAVQDHYAPAPPQPAYDAQPYAPPAPEPGPPRPAPA